MNDTVPALNNSAPATANPSPNPQEQARALRHAAVTERAINLLAGSTPKLATFRNTVSSYRSNGITAPALIDAFFALFDTTSTDLGTLIKELADIFESNSKRDDLLKAWNDWKAINEDYPSLPGLPPGASSSGGSGKRILKLKTSTAQSSRSAVNQQAGWGSLAPKVAYSSGAGPSLSRGPAGISSRPNPASHFPNLPSNPNRVGAGKVTTTPWVSSVATRTASSTPVSNGSSFRPPPAPSSRTNNAARGATGMEFPSLPAAQKPGMNVSRPGYFGNPTLKVRSGASTPSASAWGAGGVAGMSSPPEVVDGSGELAGGKGKGKKKGATLIKWG